MSRTVNGTCTPRKKTDESCWAVCKNSLSDIWRVGPPNEHWRALATIKEDAEYIVECVNAYANVKPDREHWLYNTGREHGRAEMRAKAVELVEVCNKFVNRWSDGRMVSPEESALVQALSEMLR